MLIQSRSVKEEGRGRGAGQEGEGREGGGDQSQAAQSFVNGRQCVFYYGRRGKKCVCVGVLVYNSDAHACFCASILVGLPRGGLPLKPFQNNQGPDAAARTTWRQRRVTGIPESLMGALIEMSKVEWESEKVYDYKTDTQRRILIIGLRIEGRWSDPSRFHLLVKNVSSPPSSQTVTASYTNCVDDA